MSTGLFKVYRSSAGSGKTFTLVREYLRLSLSGTDAASYRHILAITFTNKAATEMKERVLSSLKGFSKLESDPDFDEVMFSMIRSELHLSIEELQKRASACFEHMLHHYSDVAISTIDKFVHSVIRSFARDLQLNPDFEVEIDMAGLIEKSVDELLSLVGLDNDLSELLVQFAQSRLEDESNWNIKKDLTRFAKHLHKEESGYFMSLISEMNNDSFKEVRNLILKYNKIFTDRVLSFVEKSEEEIASSGVDLSLFSGGDLPNYLKKLKNDEYIATTTRLTKSMDKGYLGKATDKGEDRSIMEIASNGVIPILNELNDFIESEYTNVIIGNAVLKGIYPLATLKRIEDQIEEIKLREGILPISDFNRMVSSVVAENPAPFIYERIGERFNHFLIDEFQDTSVLQWQNFLPLLENSLSKAKFNMVVGDGKQAIYRWRSGEVEQFDRLPEIYKHQGKSFIKDKEEILKYNYQEARLKSNFRSKYEVIDFNNKLFTRLSEELSGAYQSIYENHEQEMHKGKGGLVSVEIIPKKMDDAEELNLSFLLKNIQEAQEAQFPLSSMAVICRKNKQAKLVARFLLENNIPVISSESLMLTQDAAVELVISTLKILNHPEDTTAAISIIRNYYVVNDAISEIDSTLWKYRKENPKYKREVSIDIHAFLRDVGLNELIDAQSEDGLYESFERVIRAYKLHEQANVFIEFLAEQIHQFAVRRRNDIEAFLSWWDGHGDALSIRMAKGLDAVTIMTIHKSKGLEFPVVFLPFLNWSSHHQDEAWIELGDRFNPLKAALVSLNKEFEKTEYADVYIEESNKKILDDLNLLYVACTRAKDRLYIVAEDGRSPSNKIITYIQSIDDPSLFQNGRWQFGEAHKYESEKLIQTDVEMSRFPSRALYSQLKLSLESPRNWDIQQPLDARERGTLLHQILEKYTGLDSLGLVVESVVDNPLLRDKWQERIKQCLKIPQVQKWFDSSGTILTEVSFLDRDGNIYRPDRVVLSDDLVEIIDYKTGEENTKYGDQIRTYMNLAKEIYQIPVRGYLLYLDKGKVEEVVFSSDLFDGRY